VGYSQPFNNGKSHNSLWEIFMIRSITVDVKAPVNYLRPGKPKRRNQYIREERKEGRGIHALLRLLVKR